MIDILIASHPLVGQQNVKINEQFDVQINFDFYSPPQKTVFEIVLFFYNTKTKQPQKYYFDVIFDCVKHDFYFVINSFQEFFKTKF